MQCNAIVLKAGAAMAIQISKYQSAESSPVSLKFATKCSEGRLHLMRLRKKDDMEDTFISKKWKTKIMKTDLVLTLYPLLMETFSKVNEMKSSLKH